MRTIIPNRQGMSLKSTLRTRAFSFLANSSAVSEKPENSTVSMVASSALVMVAMWNDERKKKLTMNNSDDQNLTRQDHSIYIPSSGYWAPPWTPVGTLDYSHGRMQDGGDIVGWKDFSVNFRPHRLLKFVTRITVKCTVVSRSLWSPLRAVI